ncbi:MAG TPA: TldD/PmbA family protein [Thermoanaerobaculia bacterium]|jgi:PmbA protein|nr:TldD/PmbA family protein [Thermoanaerobaculia bacterium]
MAKTNEHDMMAIAQSCIAMAKSAGANNAAARAYRVRDVSLDYRDGKVEKISEATTRGIALQLYVDGRYSTASTSDVRPKALEQFIGDSVALAKTIQADPFRGLPDPALYKGQAAVDLQLEDPKYSAVSADEARRVTKAMYDAAKSVKGSEALTSITASYSSNLVENWMVTSNGFSGSNRGTSFFVSASVSAKDADGRRPEEYDYAGSRYYSGVGDVTGVGVRAAQRTLNRLGSKKGETNAMTVVVDNRASGRLVSMMLGPLSGGSLQQKRSFLEGKIGQQIVSPLITLTDDPLIAKGFGSRKFDNEGIAAKARSIIDGGVLKSYYIDTYYGRKLKMDPTSGSPSNLVWKLGSKSQKELLSDVKNGLLITGFIGGNSNGGTGDFSIGVVGFRVREGAIAEPVAEMNLSGNHLEFWKKLVALGNDPFAYSSNRAPSLVFENVSVAGV